jgi:hypothetical protein
MHRQWWQQAACWWWLPMWCRRRTTRMLGLGLSVKSEHSVSSGCSKVRWSCSPQVWCLARLPLRIAGLPGSKRRHPVATTAELVTLCTRSAVIDLATRHAPAAHRWHPHCAAGQPPRASDDACYGKSLYSCTNTSSCMVRVAATYLRFISCCCCHSCVWMNRGMVMVCHRRCSSNSARTPDMLCSAAQHASPLSGMVPVYLLMSAFHSAPWLRHISSRRSGAHRP